MVNSSPVVPRFLGSISRCFDEGKEEECFAEEARRRGEVTYESNDDTVENDTKLEDEKCSDLLTERALLPIDDRWG